MDCPKRANCLSGFSIPLDTLLVRVDMSVGSSVFSLRKLAGDYFSAVPEDPGHLPPGPQRVHQTAQRTERKFVLDVIHDTRSRAFIHEAMRVPPHAIRAAQLHVDEL